MLTVNVQKMFGGVTIEAAFESAVGVTALYGPSGAGKTSIVSMIAGLLKPDRGRIDLDDTTLFDSEHGIHIPAYRRRMGYVFQEGRLFPHMSVAQNLDYGRWMNRLPRDTTESDRVIALLDLAPLLTRRPRNLSGGERQRVAIGRALLAKPRLLLLDEPLASLDRSRKQEILPYLARLRDESKVPMIYVSHQAGEIVKIASQVVRIEDGRVVETGGLDLLDAERRSMVF